MKRFDILAIHPTLKREARFKRVSADKLFTNEHGETCFHFNKWFDRVECITVTEVPQETLAAEAAYFDRYGTANE